MDKYILLQHDLNKISISEAREMHNQVSKMFPDMPVITLPSTSSLTTLDRYEIEGIVDWLSKFLEEN